MYYRKVWTIIIRNIKSDVMDERKLRNDGRSIKGAQKLNPFSFPFSLVSAYVVGTEPSTLGKG